MMLVYKIGNLADGHLETHLYEANQPLPDDAVWIDLLEPTREEDRAVEDHLKLAIPTHEDMKDIEPSEILYAEHGARYMTARVISAADSDRPRLAATSFILAPKTLVTVRYDQPRSFSLFASRALKPGGCHPTPEAVLAGLIEAIIDRSAEVLQQVGEVVDNVSYGVFDPKAGRQTDRQQETLRTLGRQGDLVSKVRESLVSIERMLLFITASMANEKTAAELRARARTVFRDLQSLEEHASFISGKIQFLLDATLGLVNLEQNNIIKLFSVMAVVFMPPTLIASIYGMNFHSIPELDFSFGYPMALCMMVISAIVPYLIFKWKKWL